MNGLFIKHPTVFRVYRLLYYVPLNKFFNEYGHENDDTFQEGSRG